MITLRSNLRIPSYVVFAFVEGDAVLLNTRTNKYFALTEVGAHFWTYFKEGKNLYESYQALLDEYEVEPSQLQQDILELVNQLMENSLVELAPA